MKLKPTFEIVQVADEYLAVPVGAAAGVFHGIVALSEAAAFLLQNAQGDSTEEELVQLLLDNYQVDEETAYQDLRSLTEKLRQLGMIEE